MPASATKTGNSTMPASCSPDPHLQKENAPPPSASGDHLSGAHNAGSTSSSRHEKIAIEKEAEIKTVKKKQTFLEILANPPMSGPSRPRGTWLREMNFWAPTST